MALRIRPSLALLALATLIVTPCALATGSPDPAASLARAEGAKTLDTPDLLPSLESQLAEPAGESAQSVSSCPIAKCIPWEYGCASDCICRIINCVARCLPLPLRPDSCQ